MMEFGSPWAFLLLLVIPLMLWRRRQSEPRAVRYSSLNNVAMAGMSWRQGIIWLPPFLRVAALVLLVIALARPQHGLEVIRDISQGIAIEMVVDRSGSMGQEMLYDGLSLTRLDVVKRVFHDFVLGDGHKLEGRPSDLVGMISFARYPDTVCPLTLAHDTLPRFLDTVQLVTDRQEDGTAIGDAIALAAARLQKAEEAYLKQTDAAQEDYEIKSKIIILLTDGENTAGKRDPVAAADLAASWGIKIYTIGVGGLNSLNAMNRFLGQIARHGIDEKKLKTIAEKSGGIYRLAKDARSLREIYREIDRLERTDIESIRYVDHKELFGLFALAALAMVGAEGLLNTTLLRRIP